jgi:ribosomal protein S18 acetylase RimI-like enzyme
VQGSIYRLSVAPIHRRRGLGRRLLEEGERRLRNVGAARLGAIVVDNDDQTIGFWRNSGWYERTHRARFVKG